MLDELLGSEDMDMDLSEARTVSDNALKSPQEEKTVESAGEERALPRKEPDAVPSTDNTADSGFDIEKELDEVFADPEDICFDNTPKPKDTQTQNNNGVKVRKVRKVRRVINTR